MSTATVASAAVARAAVIAVLLVAGLCDVEPAVAQRVVVRIVEKDKEPRVPGGDTLGPTLVPGVAVQPSALAKVCAKALKYCFPDTPEDQLPRDSALTDIWIAVGRLWWIRTDGWILQRGRALTVPQPPSLRIVTRCAYGDMLESWHTEDWKQPGFDPFDTQIDPDCQVCTLDGRNHVRCRSELQKHARFEDWPGRFVDLQAANVICALSVDGRVVCEGDVHALATPAGRLSQLVLGANVACALNVRRRAICWRTPTNYLEWSELRDKPSLWPTPDRRFVQLAARGVTACGLTAKGEAYCFSLIQAHEQRVLPGRFTQVAVANERICALDAAGQVTCWPDPFMVWKPAPEPWTPIPDAPR
jgi:hypothetical protein